MFSQASKRVVKEHMDQGGHVNGPLDVHQHSQINASYLTSSNQWLGPLYKPYRYCHPKGYGFMAALV